MNKISLVKKESHHYWRLYGACFIKAVRYGRIDFQRSALLLRLLLSQKRCIEKNFLYHHQKQCF